MSINTTDENFKNDMDNASSIKDRLATLKTLHENGIKTILFMSPIFPYITDWKNIIDKSSDFIDTYWFENLNLRGSYKKIIMDYIKEKYPKYYPEYIKIYDKKDDAYWRKLSKEIDDYCLEKQINYINFFYHDKLVKNKKETKKD